MATATVIKPPESLSVAADALVDLFAARDRFVDALYEMWPSADAEGATRTLWHAIQLEAGWLADFVKLDGNGSCFNWESVSRDFDNLCQLVEWARGLAADVE